MDRRSPHPAKGDVVGMRAVVVDRPFQSHHPVVALRPQYLVQRIHQRAEIVDVDRPEGIVFLGRSVEGDAADQFAPLLSFQHPRGVRALEVAVGTIRAFRGTLVIDVRDALDQVEAVADAL